MTRVFAREGLVAICDLRHGALSGLVAPFCELFVCQSLASPLQVGPRVTLCQIEFRNAAPRTKPTFSLLATLLVCLTIEPASKLAEFRQAKSALAAATAFQVQQSGWLSCGNRT